MSLGLGDTGLVFMNARGDHLINLPAVRALATIFEGTLRLVCRPGARSTFFAAIPFRSVVEPPTRCSKLQYHFDAEAVAAALGPVDLVLCLNPGPSDSMNRLLALTAPRRSVGFDRAYSTPLPLDDTKHSADLAFDLVHALDPHQRIERYASPPVISPEAADVADRVIAALPSDAVVVAMQADTKAEKLWPAERFRQVVADLARRVPPLVVLDLGLRDMGIARGAVCDRVVRCGHLPLQSAMALVAIADLFIGVDSCFLHAADLFGVPGVGLFGPTSAVEFGFRFGPHRHVCGSTMEAISGDAVTAAVAALDEETKCLQGGRRRRVVAS